MIYNIKRFFWKIKNLFKWLPIIWEQYDFDYNYSLEVFKFQLKKQAEFLESDKAYTQCAKINAGKIRTVLKLMDRVYDDYYGGEYQDKLELIYGKGCFNTSFTTLKWDKELSDLSYDIELKLKGKDLEAWHRDRKKYFKESIEKQKKAHRILWKLVEHNIQGWWD
tara:strand:+ start:261 stop:755 length:495 start_codon:yes stop_codon:yes gene_type:complete